MMPDGDGSRAALIERILDKMEKLTPGERKEVNRWIAAQKRRPKPRQAALAVNQ